MKKRIAAAVAMVAVASGLAAPAATAGHGITRARRPINL